MKLLRNTLNRNQNSKPEVSNYLIPIPSCFFNAMLAQQTNAKTSNSHSGFSLKLLVFWDVKVEQQYLGL